MFGFKKKTEVQQQPKLEESILPQQDTLKQEFLNNDILNPIKKESVQDVRLPIEAPELDFDTIEVKTRPSVQSGFQLATFTDLSSLSKRTPIFVFRDKKMNTYFALHEGKMFYLKK